MANVFSDRQPMNVGDVISDGFMYTPKGVAVDGRGIRQNIPPYNQSSFVGGETMSFMIPTSRPNHFLNGRLTMLKLTLNNPDANTLAVDYTADSLIQSLSLHHGSNQVENIREYGCLATVFKDLQGAPNKDRILAGQHASTARTGLDVAASGGSLTVCIPIMSGLVGLWAPKYLPTFAMTGGDLRLDLELATNANAVVHNTAESTWTVSNVELILEYGELTPSATASIMRAYPDFVFNFSTYENFNQPFTTSSAAQSILIPARYSRLKTLYTMFRPTANFGDIDGKTVSNRPLPSTTDTALSWQYDIGGVLMPSKPVKGAVESFAQVVKAYHGLGDRHDVNITLAQWTTKTAAANDAAFLIGLDAEWLSNKSHSAISGIDTKTLNTYLLLSDSAGGYATACRVESYAEFDVVAFTRNGVLDVRR